MNNKVKQIYVFMLTKITIDSVKSWLPKIWCVGCDSTFKPSIWTKHLIEDNCVGYKKPWWK